MSAANNGPTDQRPAVAAAPVWMLRVNPLTRRRLADDQLSALVEEVAARTQAAAPLAAAASEDLYRMVPMLAEPLRGRVLGLRRDIHNGRSQPAEQATSPLSLPASVAAWSENQRHLQAAQKEIGRTYEAALARERDGLRRDLGNADFLVTLSQSAAGVFDAALRYRSHPSPDAKDRKAERSLLQYLTRAMVRTSPYGRFTAVALAAPVVGGTALAGVSPDGARPYVEVDRSVFDYLTGGLVPTADDPLVARPPSARVVDGRITFFQVGESSMRRLSAPLNRQTKTLLDLVDLGPQRRSSLAEALSQALGLPHHDADHLIGLALGLGLLVSAWQGDEFVAEPVALALRAVAAAGGDDQIPEALRRLHTSLTRLGQPGEPGEPEARVWQLRDLERLGTELGQLARRPARVRVNEDMVIDPLPVDASAYDTALDDLAVVTELLCTFDRMPVARALVSAALVERFGSGCRVPLTDHAQWLVHEVYRRERTLAAWPDAALGPADGSLAMLAKIRQEALRSLGAGLWTGDPATDEVVWSPAGLRQLVDGIPDRFRLEPACYGVVVQAEGPDLLLNDAYAGHGPMVSRFLHADELRGGNARARLRDRLQRLYGPGTRLREHRSWHQLGINAHPPVVDEALDPAAWRRLCLVHLVDTDTVAIVDADGAPVTVLALGAQLPELFPYPVRLATWLCSSGRVALDLAAKAHQGQRAENGVIGRATSAYRQLRVGRVVLSRRRWYPGDDFPTAAQTPDGVEYLLALTAWRARHGAPAEVMLKSDFEGPVLWESLGEVGPRERFFELRNQSKPQYVDLASATMTRVLPRLLERRPASCLEEARPALTARGHASEWMIEMSRPKGHDSFEWRAPSEASPV